jgi:predicted nucleic acid-binding Zn ribbon protein
MKKLQWNLLRNNEKNSMSGEQSEIATHTTHQKEFERTLYVCEDDDVWVTIERPVKV